MGTGGLSRARYPWWLEPAARLGAWMLLLIGRTWRIVRVGQGERETAEESDPRVVFAFWHARMFPLVYTHRHRGNAVLVSHHRDGELIARLVGHLGFVSARGSSTRGGDEGLREMMRFAEERRQLGISPDGPRGPAERVKPGLIFLASQLGFRVVPVASSARHSWVFRSWDRFRIPLPFARVVVGYGSPIEIPRSLEPAEVETWRERVETAMRDLTEDLRRRSGEAR